MANRGTRYDPLRLIEEAELDNFDTEAVHPVTHVDNENIPMQSRRRLREILMASVALNAVLLMTCAWQYLRIRRLMGGR